MAIEDVWGIMCDYLYFLNKGFDVDIYSFVLMSNHFHLILKSPEANLSADMQYFMLQTSRAITKHQDRINQTYGSRFFRSLVSADIHFQTVYKYVYRNPIEAAICDRAEDYKYSTLRGLLGYSRLDVPVVEDMILFPDPQATLIWLNQSPQELNRMAVRKALRRPVFTLPRDEQNKQPHPLNFNSY